MMFMDDSSEVMMLYDTNCSATVVRLPGSDRPASLLLLPKAELQPLEDCLSDGRMNFWLSHLKPGRAEIRFPKFQLRKSYGLERLLRNAGVSSVFSRSADFSGISQKKTLELIKVLKMQSIFAICAVVALLLAAVWADHHEHHDHNQHHHHDHSSDHSHDGMMSCHKLSPPNADFAFALYKNLNAKPEAGKNIFYSPLGISTALSMLSTGAGGDTHSQLFSTLGYGTLNQSQVNEAFQHLFHMLDHSQENQKLDVGNAVAVRTGFEPQQQYLDDIKQYYSGDIFRVDFTKPEEAAAFINRNIAGKTQDKIKDIVKDLDPAMAMVLINYVYFRGQWEKPFDGNRTHKADFHVDENTKVEVDMMKRTGRYDFYQDADNHTTVILLPYKGNTSMMIVLPDEGKMKEVEGHISRERIHHWHDSLFRNSVDLHMPKFSISADASLDSTLKQMGITDAFGDDADFSGISEEVKLKVSKVSHQAVLSVDETGTEAAAATTIEIMPMSMPETMKLNRPFMLFILEHSTRSILFMGKINNPAAV
uniref:Serpin domain-containing protein n=2 Tax=Amphiprion ocellaris TaxID=80972 RepID=A0A3Q1B6A9_AMPOC